MIQKWLMAITVSVAVFAGVFPQDVRAQSAPDYDIGSPQVKTIYVSLTGSDDNDGSSRESGLRTLTEAWARIPIGETLANTGFHILLLPGTYMPEDAPNYWESRYGTFESPIIIEAVDGKNTVFLPSLNLFDVRFVCFINLNIEVGTDAFHCEKCDHILVRGMRMVGAEPDSYNTQETVKVNQSRHIYFEDNDISGAWDNAVDFVAVQYGHFRGNKIHNAGDWCMYLKGGSAYFRVEGNELYDCGTGGFTAGQGTGFQFMVEPWIQYEAYDIKFVNNLVHHTRGAGIGVQGGYNILIAYNTFYRIGENSHLLEIGFGSRSCDGQPGDEGRERCDAYRAAGGWGNSAVADGINYVRIPNRNVLIINNLLYNSSGFQSQYQHFSIFSAYEDVFQADSDVSVPTLADDNLQIRGNVIWNGGADMPLGVEPNPDFPAGCQNASCNLEQLLTDNAINTIELQLVDPANGDFRLASEEGLTIYPLPDFTWDVPVPEGDLSNAVLVAFDGQPRPAGDAPGAFGRVKD